MLPFCRETAGQVGTGDDEQVLPIASLGRDGPLKTSGDNPSIGPARDVVPPGRAKTRLPLTGATCQGK